MATLIDSYPSANKSGNSDDKTYHPSSVNLTSAAGQAFTCSLSNMKIIEAIFYIAKVGSPTGNAHAVLYAITGTYGTNAVPTGSALATSDDFDISTFGTTHSLKTFTFSGAQQYVMQDSTYYCIEFENPASGGGAFLDTHNYIRFGIDITSSTHSGNGSYYRNGSWSVSTNDRIFYVYGDPAPTGALPTSLSLTPAPKGGIGRPALLTGGASFGG